MADTLSGKTLFITGASRGIGLAIGLRCARDGANVAIAAKTAEPNPKLPGTIYSAAEEIERAWPWPPQQWLRSRQSPPVQQGRRTVPGGG
jgi:NAD(P)-dependent dehydrogenase (short-subunit alcohol dehydrogenase family)